MDTPSAIRAGASDSVDAVVQTTTSAAQAIPSPTQGEGMDAGKAKAREIVATDMDYMGKTYNLRIWRSHKRGSGSLGSVFEADMVDPDQKEERVVVKIFRGLFLEWDETLQLPKFAEWQRLDHSRIWPFYGFTSEFGLDQVGIVSPLAQNGNLLDLIRRKPGKDRLRLVNEVAEGMRYLHSVSIVHGDLKCENVLISGDESALLADFGLSTLLEQATSRTATNIRTLNTVTFCAPELQDDHVSGELDREIFPAAGTPPTVATGGTGCKTAQSDVFAFGALVYEAYSCTETSPGRNSVSKMICRAAARGELPPREVNGRLAVPICNALWNVCVTCWDIDPFRRPDSQSIVDALTELSRSSSA